ncbi:MAG: bifunctional demethylmenaquinone methyltransferase/2-methoxy-6-polyprenyl-1,4-benzoquinol methylase UbiE [Halioglobus sp.]
MTDAHSRVAPHPVLPDYYASEEARRRRVDQMFDDSAEHYDWINSVMSFGSGERYRQQALSRVGFEPGMSVLDAGSGTGVVAKLEQDMVGESGITVALDPSKGMLGEAKKRGVRFATQGLGERLPFGDDCFDRVTMSYALRHVVDLRVLFDEYLRVLKPGGKLLILEITRPDSAVGHALLNLYMKTIVPALTRVFRRSAEAEELMRYYWETIEHCVPPQTILETMRAAGLQSVQREVTAGTFSEYTAEKGSA